MTTSGEYAASGRSLAAEVAAATTEAALRERRLPRRGPLVRRALVVADVVGFVVAYLVAELVSGESFDIARLIIVVAAIPFFLLAAKLYRLYDRDEQRADHSTIDELVPLVHLVTVFAWAAFVAAWVLGRDWDVSALIAFWGAALLSLTGSRSLARSVIRSRPAYKQNTLIVGAGDVGQLIGRKLQQHPELGLRLVGFVDADPKNMRSDLDGIPVLGGTDDTVALVRRHDIHRVVVAFSNERHASQVELVRSLRELDVQVDLVPRLFEAVGPIVGIHSVEGLPLVGLPPVRISRTGRVVKRTLDVVGASVGIVLVSPLLLWIAWRIRRDSDGSVLFRQTRLGEGMQPFTMFKFRTMATDTDDAPHRAYIRQIMDPGAAPNESNLYKLERPNAVTRFGGRLRRTSLDELPQLINVLRGEMSLVGPRPCLPYETELFEAHHFDRFLVPAGMTGFWQVVARAHATLKEALDLDASYARNWSFALDLKLLVRTPFVVFGRRGTA